MILLEDFLKKALNGCPILLVALRIRHVSITKSLHSEREGVQAKSQIILIEFIYLKVLQESIFLISTHLKRSERRGHHIT